LAAEGQKSLKDLKITKDCVAIFGNEARGLATAQGVSSIEQVKISMPGNAESLNLSAAATIVMYHLANIPSS
jgi:TrmH family RNA methyltransferase